MGDIKASANNSGFDFCSTCSKLLNNGMMTPDGYICGLCLRFAECLEIHLQEGMWKMDKKIEAVKKTISKKMEKLVSEDKKRDKQDNAMRKKLHLKAKKD